MSCLRNAKMDRMRRKEFTGVNYRKLSKGYFMRKSKANTCVSMLFNTEIQLEYYHWDIWVILGANNVLKD